MGGLRRRLLVINMFCIGSQAAGWTEQERLEGANDGRKRMDLLSFFFFGIVHGYLVVITCFYLVLLVLCVSVCPHLYMYYIVGI